MVIPQYLQGIGSMTPLDTKIQGCSRPLYKMKQYTWSSLFVGSASVDTEGQLYKYLIHLEFFLCVYKVGNTISFFPLFIFSLTYNRSFFTDVVDHLSYMSNSLMSALLHCSICLCLEQYYSVSITIALEEDPNLIRVIPPPCSSSKMFIYPWSLHVRII